MTGFKLKQTKPKMLRLMNTALLGGLLTSTNMEVTKTDSILCHDKSLQTVVSWAEFAPHYFSGGISSPDGSLVLTESMLKATKKIRASDIEFELNENKVSIKGGSFEYSESKQPTNSKAFDIEVNEETQLPLPPIISKDEILVTIEIDSDEIQKLPSAEKYTFVIDKNLKVITEDVGTLEIELSTSKILASKPSLNYIKSFSGEIFEKIVSNFDGKLQIQFGDKFLIISSGFEPAINMVKVNLLVAQASLVDSENITV